MICFSMRRRIWMSKDFSLKKFKIDQLRLNASKADLIEVGKKQAKEIPVDQLGIYKPVDRDVVQMIKTQ